MAILHQASLKPSKLELLAAHLRAMPQFAELREADISLIGAYRFDDPAGQVGIETHLVSTGGQDVIQVPLTYRAEPLANAEEWLIATMEHSVLGKRWIYNACADPVYVSELVRTILTGDTQVEQFVDTPDGPVEREPSARVVGSGTSGTEVPTIDSVDCTTGTSSTVIRTHGLELVVRHQLSDAAPIADDYLAGSWQGQNAPVTLAILR